MSEGIGQIYEAIKPPLVSDVFTSLPIGHRLQLSRYQQLIISLDPNAPVSLKARWANELEEWIARLEAANVSFSVQYRRDEKWKRVPDVIRINLKKGRRIL